MDCPLSLNRILKLSSGHLKPAVNSLPNYCVGIVTHKAFQMHSFEKDSLISTLRKALGLQDLIAKLEYLQQLLPAIYSPQTWHCLRIWLSIKNVLFALSMRYNNLRTKHKKFPEGGLGFPHGGEMEESASHHL